ncbi:hypothetical protein HR060_02685 [Catenovulum sp. SM1970]|uniref:DUF6482 family protein n=1 Tax=Marinifaba aquimaris TaxID=2741323 RepID=UPI0015729063|nr:DUF6482 family protein [Marinifaba aquimaris]NTS75762.1 hypothetical protein [Marinifaba aquimaris]
MEIRATIIGVADSTHYLVGVTDGQEKFVALPQLNDIAVCSSLCEAKQLLIEHRFDSAELHMESAYDEMCGLPSSGVYKQLLTL